MRGSIEYAFEMKFPVTGALVTVHCLSKPGVAGIKGSIAYPFRFEWLETGQSLFDREIQRIYDEAHELAQQKDPRLKDANLARTQL